MTVRNTKLRCTGAQQGTLIYTVTMSQESVHTVSKIQGYYLICATDMTVYCIVSRDLGRCRFREGDKNTVICYDHLVRRCKYMIFAIFVLVFLVSLGRSHFPILRTLVSPTRGNATSSSLELGLPTSRGHTFYRLSSTRTYTVNQCHLSQISKYHADMLHGATSTFLIAVRQPVQPIRNVFPLEY